MAALTWRNVDAPSFASSNDMYRIAAGLMNSGFDAARRGVDDFRSITTEDQSAALMQSIMAAGNDTSAIAQAAAGANPAFISADALRFANNQPGVLLERQGQGLRNTVAGQTIRANDFDFERAQIGAQRADENFALLPTALQEAGNLRAALASGDPAKAAAAEGQYGNFLSTYGRALGITDMAGVGQFMTGNMNAQNDGMTLGQNRINHANFLDNAIRNNNSEGIVNGALAYADNNPQEAIRLVQGFTDLDYKTKEAVLGELTRFAEIAPQSNNQSLIEDLSLFSGSPATRPALPDSYQAITYNNQGAGRNQPLSGNLSAALEAVLPQYGVTARVNSGGIEPGDGPLQKSGRHVHGNAGDVNFVQNGRNLSWENPNDVPLLQSIVTDLKGQGLTGFGAGPGYMNPETTHIGYGNEAVWGAKGGSPYDALSAALGAARTLTPNGNNQSVPQGSPVQQQLYQAAMDAVQAGENYEAPIDTGRVQVRNADGSISTERTSTFEIGGTWFNVPTMVNGQEMTEEQAFTEFQNGRNPAVGVFQSKREAEDAAQARSDEIGKMLETASTTPDAAPSTSGSNQSQANEALTQALTPTLEQTTAPVSTPAEDTFPKVDTTATQYVQDQQKRARESAINNAIADLTGSTGGGFGSGIVGGVQGMLDYYTQSPETAAANATTRDRSNNAGNILAQNADFFRQNPDQIAVAQADPLAYAENFGNTDAQRAFLGNQGNEASAPASSSGGASVPLAEAAAPTALPSSQRDMMSAFAVAENAGALNATAVPYRALTESVQNRELSGEGADETARRLADGTMKDIPYTQILNAVNTISTELDVNPATAGALLGARGVTTYNEGFFTLGQGFNPDINKAREVWNNFNNGEGGEGGMSPGAGQLFQSDQTRMDEQEIASLKSQYTDMEARVAAAITSPDTTQADRAILEQLLADMRAETLAKLDAIVSRGNITANAAGQMPR